LPLKKLVFVDDEPSYLSLIIRLLDRKRFSVETVTSAAAALEEYLEKPIDILITDLIMPEMNGIELIERMRKRQQSLSVIVVSAQQDMDIVIQAMKLGNVDYIRKPFEFRSLMVAIESALEKKQLREDLEEANRKLNSRVQEQAVALEKSRAFFNAMAENSHELLIELDIDLTYIYCSPNVESVCGFKVEDLIKRNLLDLVQDADRLRLMALYKELRETPRTFSGVEFNSMSKAGDLMVYEITGIPLYTREGKLRGFLALLRNVTEQKSARKKLENSRNLLMTSVESIPFEFFSLNAVGVVTLQNRISRDGYWGEMVGENIDRIEYPAKHIPDWSRMLEEGRNGRLVDREWKTMCDDSLCYYRTILSPIMEEREVSGLVGFNIDITERKTAQSQLLRVSAAVDQVQETILLTDLEGNLTFANPAFSVISGYQPEQYLGRSPFEILRSTDGEKPLQGKEVESVFSYDVWQSRIHNQRIDGTEYVEDVTISPIRSASGEIVQFVCVGRNITEELKYEKQLMHAQKMEAIGTLAGGIAHDFNNILSSITGYTQLVQDDLDPGSEAGENIEQVLIAAGRAEKLVKQILLFSRRDEQIPFPVDVVSLIQEVTSLLRSAIPSSIKVSCFLRSENSCIMADPTQLHQVILNLCTNAVDAMRESGGELKISFDGLARIPACVADSASHAEKWSCLEVEDTGTGIPQEIQGKIFDPFFTSKPMDQGTGMGLSVVHGIVEELRGHVLFDSTPGKGTIFRVYLPVGAIDEELSPENVTNFEESGGTILLVDDEHAILQMEQRRLSRDGWKVLTASSGKEALDILMGKRISAVVTDLKMPEMDGETLCREIRRLYPDVSVILATSHLKDEPFFSVDKSLFDEILIKPVAREKMIGAIAQCVSKTSHP